MQSGRSGEKVVLGKLGKAHGVKGWMLLHSFTEPPENILNYQNLQAETDNRQLTLLIDQSREQGVNLLVHLQGVDDPQKARTLTGSKVWVDACELPELADGEFYWQELINMLVVNEQGILFGQVSRLVETGANDVLVVQPTLESIDQRERLIPYLKVSVIKQVDKQAGCITVDWDASYLG
ncbi:MAG: ribosome maturation factor RimM [Gammaproteobacteria bacterium]|nr:ribosome maturation factor RimM [Gammaproteobacteria bacterium]